MTNKEALKKLKTVLSTKIALTTNSGMKKYSDVVQDYLLNPVKKDLETLNKKRFSEE